MERRYDVKLLHHKVIMDFYYTDERNAQMVISLLKAHNIRKVIASPGGTNICLVASLQQDPYFEVYSSVDERSAAYMACGMAAELKGKEAIVLSCTGATASRNYLPALTEAYYRKLPILVITSSKRNYEIGHNVEQVTDRTLLPRDVAKLSVQVPIVYDKESEWACTVAINKAMLELFHRDAGPVHINLETTYSRNYTVKKLPDTRAIYRYGVGDKLPEIKANKVAVVVGAHLVWTPEEIEAVEKFCEENNGVVICDHTSNYTGKYRVFGYLASLQKDYTSVIKKVDLVIHIGDVSGSEYGINMNKVWRVNPDGELRDTFKRLHNVFEMTELEFFTAYSGKKNAKNTSFYEECFEEEQKLENNLPELPFSNAWIASQTAHRLPSNAVLHLGIRNSLRFWNCFDDAVEVPGFSNTGGFGIDGCMSSTVGASLIHPDKIYYCVLGDLAFFYDMNSLGNRHVGKNVRIILINNGCGAEFWLSHSAAPLFGEETNDYIAAGGHYGNKSMHLVKHYAEDLGFKYLCATNKDEYSKILEEIVSPQIGEQPLLVEIFTTNIDEDEALQKLSKIQKDDVQAAVNSVKQIARGVIGESSVSAIKKVLNRRTN